jgi:hypothetical protein
MGAPAGLAVQSVFSFRSVLCLMTASAASRMVCVER